MKSENTTPVKKSEQKTVYTRKGLTVKASTNKDEAPDLVIVGNVSQEMTLHDSLLSGPMFASTCLSSISMLKTAFIYRFNFLNLSLLFFFPRKGGKNN